MLENFDLMLRQLPETKEMSLAMLAAWKRGDLAALQKIAEVEDMRRQAPRAYQEIFTKRNANWVERIQEWLAGKGNYFVAAGAGHFAGPDSVVAMLQKKGIKVERVQ
jgi:uncharacterized protein YbaP (TraB family)